MKLLDEIKNLYPNANISEITEIRNKDGVFVGRLKIDNQSCVVKKFDNTKDAVEIDYYVKLKELNVETPKLLNHTSNFMIMEDFSANSKYKLATQDDLKNEKIIKSLAKWYKSLHIAGRNFDVKNLYSEIDFLTQQNLTSLKKLLPNCENLQIILNNFDTVQQKINSLNFTLTYNDFAVENMIVNNDKAIMFDYDLMGKGLAWFDIQNVSFMLEDKYKEIFIQEYGKIDEYEKLVYDVFIPFITLIMANQKPTFPSWAEPYKTKAYDNDIKLKLLKFIDKK